MQTSVASVKARRRLGTWGQGSVRSSPGRMGLSSAMGLPPSASAAVHGGNMLRGLNATAGDAGHLLSSGDVTYESRLGTEAFMRLLGLEESLSPAERRAALCRIASEEPKRYDEALDKMAAVAANRFHAVLWMLDPTHIIIDCVYARPRGDVFAQSVARRVRERFGSENRLLPQIAPAASGVSSVLRGAVHVLQRAWLDRILM